MTNITRREFTKLAATAGAGAALPFWADAPSRMIGIQVGAVSFVDEGVAAVLDRFQRDAGINTLFIAAFSYGRGIAGRQIPGQPLPDHGKQEYDTDFRGGNFAHVHPQYYSGTSLKNIQAPDYGNFDVLGDVLPEARARGMKTICWYEDVFRRDLEGIERLQEVTLSGHKATTLCFHNPEVQAFWHGLTEDFVRSYPLDGIMWGSERQGPFGNAIGTSHGGASNDPAEVTCFCEYCRTEARARGINAQRAVEGYRKLADLVRTSRAGSRPADGQFVSYWRLLVQYPEILAWEKLWNDGLHNTYSNIYKLAKQITGYNSQGTEEQSGHRVIGSAGEVTTNSKSNGAATSSNGAPGALARRTDNNSSTHRGGIGVGWHIWHNNSFSPFYRAEQDYNEFRRYSDFLKVVMYNNCGGPRLAGYIRNVGRTIFADFSPEEVLNMTYREQNYQETSLTELPKRGLSADYISRETKRALAGVGGSVKIWPGIDVDIPTGENEKKTQPEDVRNAVRAALTAGADGVILSRKYSEMRLENLRAAGDAVREGIA